MITKWLVLSLNHCDGQAEPDLKYCFKIHILPERIRLVQIIAYSFFLKLRELISKNSILDNSYRALARNFCYENFMGLKYDLW